MLDSALDQVLDVAIIGAGFSGLAAAIRCQEAGIGRVRIFDKADDLGGTWHYNTYPGAACDIPSHLYSLSFAAKADWSRLYPGQAEIKAYLESLVETFGLRPALQLSTAVESAQWGEDERVWRLGTSRGAVRARALVSGMGALHHPQFPDIPGLGRFAGTSFHSSQWDHAFDARGKRVGVIGTGASAIQIVPELAETAAHLTVFQRSPPWILPKRDRPASPRMQELFRRLPWLRKTFRSRLFWEREARILLGLGRVSLLTRVAERKALAHLRQAVPDEPLRAKLTPNYRFGCKRVLLSDDYYPAVARSNVSVVAGAIREITPGGAITPDGIEHKLDALVFCTGFSPADSFSRVDIVGRNRLSLNDAWRHGASAFHGVAVSGFPNLFLLNGPHAGLGHNSVVLMIEAQVDHIVRCLIEMRRNGIAAIDLKPEAQGRFQTDLDRRMRGSIWTTGGCTSWYLDENGRNTRIWPRSVLSFRRSIRSSGLSDYSAIA